VVALATSDTGRLSARLSYGPVGRPAELLAKGAAAAPVVVPDFHASHKACWFRPNDAIFML